MLQSTYIRDLPQMLGETVELAGWAWGVRGSGKIQFVNFRDGSGFAQVVVNGPKLHLGQESAVRVKGVVVANERAPGGIEVQAGTDGITIVSATENYPITHKEHGTDFLMDRRHLWIRSPRQQAILSVRHQIAKSIRAYFDEAGFTLVDAPIFTPSECEGSSTLFATPYFEETAYLSQSGQLYMEAACQAFGRAYCFGPTFRAENSNTRRHLTEFWMVEPEVAYMDLEGDMDLACGLVQRIVRDVLTYKLSELKRLERDLAPLEKIAAAGEFPRISYSEAVDILQKNGVEFRWGDDFGGADETVISTQFELPVLVHSYPKEIKPFYMKQDLADSRVVRNMDMLAPEGYGEIIGGGERESDLALLTDALEKQGLSPADYGWYLDLRRYGSVPHAGFGLGLERALAWICALPHVRETGAFPRLPRRLRP